MYVMMKKLKMAKIKFSHEGVERSMLYAYKSTSFLCKK